MPSGGFWKTDNQFPGVDLSFCTNATLRNIIVNSEDVILFETQQWVLHIGMKNFPCIAYRHKTSCKCQWKNLRLQICVEPKNKSNSGWKTTSKHRRRHLMTLVLGYRDLRIEYQYIYRRHCFFRESNNDFDVVLNLFGMIEFERSPGSSRLRN